MSLSRLAVPLLPKPAYRAEEFIFLTMMFNERHRQNKQLAFPRWLPQVWARAFHHEIVAGLQYQLSQGHCLPCAI